MNMGGVSVGALITTILGKSADAGNLSRDIALLAVFVVAALVLQLTMLHPTTSNKIVD